METHHPRMPLRGVGPTAPEQHGCAPRSRWAWRLLTIGALGCAGYTMLPNGLARGVGFLLVAVIGVAMSCLAAGWTHPARRTVWILVATGQVLYFLGDILWMLYENVLHVSPYPSVADVAYLARYPLVAVGLLWLIRGRRQGRDRAAFLDAAIISTGFAVLGAEFVVVPAAVDGGESTLSQIVAGAYPVADLLLLAVLVRVFTSGARRCLAFWSMVSGMGLMLAADIQYVLKVVSGADLSVWENLGWLAGYLLIGFAALHPSVDHLSEPTAERIERMTFTRLAVLGTALALAPLTEAIRDIGRDRGVSVTVLIGTGAGIGLVLARMWDLLRALQVQAVQLAALARNDGLTGVPNRRTWDHELSRACADAREHDTPLTVAMLDLDHFKVFNDTQGHSTGDLALKETAAAWSRLLDGTGFLARYGGEEFAVLLHNTAADSAEAVLDRLRGAVARDQTCSIGLAVWDEHEKPDALVARADEALYHAKRHGRNRIAVHDGTRTRDSVHRGPDPAEASLYTVFQPIVELDTGKPIAYEGLSRFDGRSTRDVFDDAARLGTGVVLQAAAIKNALATWDRDMPLSVNVTITALTDARLQEALPHDLSGLIIEITDTDFVEYTPELSLLLRHLRSRGARFAVDDMGVGFSNLDRVVTIEPEIIKLDTSLVREVDRKPLHQALVRAAAAYAREAGAVLCAEGVETEHERQALVRAGVTVGQGYLFGRPAPLSALPLDSAAS